MSWSRSAWTDSGLRGLGRRSAHEDRVGDGGGTSAYVTPLSTTGSSRPPASEQTVSLWDARTGEFIRELTSGARARLQASSSAPTGTRSPSPDRGATCPLGRCTGTPVGRLEGGSTGRLAGLLYTSTDFSPDGKPLLMTMGDGRGIVWDVDPSRVERRACADRQSHADPGGVGGVPAGPAVRAGLHGRLAGLLRRQRPREAREALARASPPGRSPRRTIRVGTGAF